MENYKKIAEIIKRNYRGMNKSVQFLLKQIALELADYFEEEDVYKEGDQCLKCGGYLIVFNPSEGSGGLVELKCENCQSDYSDDTKGFDKKQFLKDCGVE